MRPEDTDKYRRVEDVLYRLADAPKEEVVKPTRLPTSLNEESEESSEDAPTDPRD